MNGGVPSMKVSLKNRTGQSIYLRWEAGTSSGGGLMYEDQEEVVHGSDSVCYGWWYASEAQPNPWKYPCVAIPTEPATDVDIRPDRCHM
jgi:hypothetical protein